MCVTNSTDDRLRKLGFKDKQTIVQYINDCAYCKQLSETYEKLSEMEKYKDVLFLKIHCDENPVAMNEVEAKNMPFISIYTQGLLLDCGCVRSEKGLIRFLDKLIKSATRKPSQQTLFPCEIHNPQKYAR